MKIGLLAFRRDSKRGGSTSHYVHRALDRHAGNEVVHLASSRADQLAGLTALRRMRRGIFRAFSRSQMLERTYIREAIHDAEESRCDVIVGCFCSNGSDLLERTDIPVVYLTDINATQIDVIDPASLERKMVLEKRMYALSSACILPSNFVADSAILDYDLDPSKAHVVPWGGAEAEGVRCDSSEGVPRSTDPIELLFIGHERHRKGFDRAITAVENLNARGHHVRLTSIGRSHQFETDSKFVDDLGLLDLGEPMDRRMFEEAFLRATCLIHPARSEPYGHVLVEACARALPVVCTSVGSMPEIIRHEISGLVVPEPFEQSRLDDAIRRLVVDPGLVSRLGERARDEWKNRLNWSSWLERVQPILESDSVVGRQQCLQG